MKTSSIVRILYVSTPGLDLLPKSIGHIVGLSYQCNVPQNHTDRYAQSGPGLETFLASSSLCELS